jgi:TetR/AcrR family transcriptional regulator, transcriptional repressor for nem operon
MATKGSITHKNIIEKSIQLFSVKGYYHTSIADIIAATGLTKGGLYGHFRNKQEIWQAGYDECVRIWKSIVFKGVKELTDPLARIERVMENSLKNYLGGDIFEGGCFLLKSLVDLAGQSPTMGRRVLEGFQAFSALLRRWLEEAEQKGLLRDGLPLQEVADFVVVSLNGAASLYAAGKDPAVWRHTLAQLRFYVNSLKK